MALFRVYLHYVWATKNREAWITPEKEAPLYHLLAEKCRELRVIPFAVNGMPDHIYIVTTLHPTVSMSQLAKQLKGASSRYMHTHFEEPFAWQAGYGVFSMGQSDLKFAVSYVEGQKEHHAKGTTNRWLESYSDEDDGPDFEKL
jgi:putative transposase